MVELKKVRGRCIRSMQLDPALSTVVYFLSGKPFSEWEWHHTNYVFSCGEVRMEFSTREQKDG